MSLEKNNNKVSLSCECMWAGMEWAGERDCRAIKALSPEWRGDLGASDDPDVRGSQPVRGHHDTEEQRSGTVTQLLGLVSAWQGHGGQEEDLDTR